ncbi:MAG: AraC family transcriptional regulator [Lachnospiraceae bacterium]
MRYFTCKTSQPLSCSVCGQLINKDGFLHHRRRFDCHVFILVTEGVLHITANEKEYDVGANQYIFLKAGEEHFGHKATKGPLSYFWVHITSDFPLEILEEEEDFSYLFPEYGEIFFSQRIQRLFRQMMDLSLEEHLYSGKMLDYTVSLLMMEITQEVVNTGHCEQKNMPPVVSSICEWIKGNYCHPFKVSELAEEFGYQANYLSTLFKDSMGISIVGYTNKIRIEAAKNLLENHGLTAKEIAYSCGFSDEKYFMKVFKKLEGSTPTRYRNNG